MYHIFAPQCQGQDSARLRGISPLRDSPPPTRQAWSRLAAAVLAGVGGVDQQVDLARAGGGFDRSDAVDEVAGARFHAEPVERRLAQRGLGPLAEVGRDRDVVGLERALERGLELALGVGRVELGAGDADPRAAARRAGADVGRDLAVGPEREPDQLVLGALAAGEDARPLGDVRLTGSSC